MPTTEQIVRATFDAYETGDAEALHALLADDFSYSAPPDPHLDKGGYFQRCWPFHHNKPCFRFKHFFIQGNEALVLYTCRHNAGPDIRNAEHFVTRDGQLAALTVFIGPAVPGHVDA